MGSGPSQPGSENSGAFYVVPWREQPVSPSDWIPVTLATANARSSPASNFFYFFQGVDLMAIRFHPEARRFGEPSAVKFVPSSPAVRPDESWVVRSPGLVFSRGELARSVWLMKLPLE